MREKKVKPFKYCGNYRNYSADSMKKAYDEVKEKKLSIRRAALQYNVPYQTLRDRVSGKIDHGTYGRETVLTKEEELSLVEHCEVSAQLGYGYSNTGLQRAAGELVHLLGRRPSNKPLSNCWLYGFLGRWKDRISSLKPSSLDSNRAKNTTPEVEDGYFANLEMTIRDHGLQNKSHLIYNLDETGISPEHRPPNVLAPVKSKAQSVTSPRSSSTTLTGCANAAGTYLPPYFVFKGKRTNDNLMEGASPGARYTMSDSGWSTTSVFKQYKEDHFLAHVRTGPNDSQPILLIVMVTPHTHQGRQSSGHLQRTASSLCYQLRHRTYCNPWM